MHVWADIPVNPLTWVGATHMSSRVRVRTLRAGRAYVHVLTRTHVRTRTYERIRGV